MVPPAPVRAVITGGPGAGKSTLLNALAERGLTVYPEVARSILQRPGGMAMRAGRPADFAMAMLMAEQEVWSLSQTGLAVFDRGFPDIAGFLNLEGLPIPPVLDEICRTWRYSGPIFHAPAWRAIYTPDDERIQSWQQAAESDEAVASAWRHYGYHLIILPRSSVTQRAEFVLEHLQPMLACSA